MFFERLAKALGVPDDAPASHAPVPDRTTRSLAHDALLVCIDPTNDKLWDHTRHIFDAALLIELVHEGRLEVTDVGKKARYTLTDSSPLGDPDLDKAMLRLESPWPGPKLARQVISLPSHDELLGRLVTQGVVVESERRSVGVTAQTLLMGNGARLRRRVHLSGSAGREELVARLRSVLLGEATPDDRTAMLLAALSVGLPNKFLVAKGRVREADRRRREIVEGVGPGKLAAISAVQAARDRTEGGYTSGV